MKKSELGLLIGCILMVGLAIGAMGCIGEEIDPAMPDEEAWEEEPIEEEYPIEDEEAWEDEGYPVDDGYPMNDEVYP